MARKKSRSFAKPLAISIGLVVFALFLDSTSFADTSLIQRAIRSFESRDTFSVPAPGSAEVAFSPNGGATDLIIRTIKSAKTSIRVAAYSFTSRPIANALVEAHKSGIDVAVLVDHSQIKRNSHSVIRILAAEKIPVRIDVAHAIQHHKFMVIDNIAVQTGSFNYSAAAENRNAENVLVLWESPELAQSYTDNWQILWDKAEPYSGDE